MRRSATALAILLITAATAAACGTLAAPVSISSGERPSGPTLHPLRLTPVEGQPRGLLLELTARADLSPRGRLRIERRIEKREAETIRTIELNGDRLERLEGRGLQFLDGSVVEDRRHHYRVVFEPPGGETTTSTPDRIQSPPLSLIWRSPPPMPRQLEVIQKGESVELRWEPNAGAAIFRRNVLENDQGARRIATVGPEAGGRFVDRSVESGGVYAYRVSLALDDGKFPQFGEPSKQVYVSVQ